MKAEKLGTIFIISVLALAGIGVSYAGWIDQITVTGTVQTGYVGFDIVEYSGSWVWKRVSTHEKFTHEGPVDPVDLDMNGKKDDDPVAYADGWYTNTDYKLVAYSYAHNAVANEEVEFEFINLYPCVNFKADFKFKIGTLPVILTGTELLWTGQTVNGISQDWIEGISGIVETPTITEEILDAAGAQIWPSDDIVQLHPDVEYQWVLTIHIPQHNAYMNAFATGSCSFGIIQWSDQCEGTQSDKSFLLPTEFVTGYYTNPGPLGLYPSYWDITLSNVPTDDDYNVANMLYDGWCVSQYITITPGPHILRLWSSLDYATDPAFPWDGNHWPGYIWDWPCVNYILNHRGNWPTAGYMDFQRAIWHFVDGGAMPSGIGATIVTDAMANVAAWYVDYPQAGDRVAVLCQVVDAAGSPLNVQHCLIDVDP